MKKIAIIFLTTLLCAACDRVYINGDLDGMWRLESVASSDSIIMPDDIFYSYQRHLVQISKHDDVELPLRFLGNMEREGNRLSVWGFRVHPFETYAPSPEQLEQFCLYSDSTAFTIEHLDDEQLIMKSNGKIYTLRKW